jgi:hypothetical protein
MVRVEAACCRLVIVRYRTGVLRVVLLEQASLAVVLREEQACG